MTELQTLVTIANQVALKFNDGSRDTCLKDPIRERPPMG